MNSGSADVLIVGGGLAGLACALELQGQGLQPLLLERSDRVGGRVRTDEVDGFLLDRGFQVLLEAYPLCRELLDYAALELRSFYSGALVRVEGAFHRVADPSRELLDAIRGVAAPIGSFSDKLKVPRLRSEVRKKELDEILHGEPISTEADLRGFGFSRRMIDTFFRPFMGGILLDRGLTTPSRLFRFYFRMMADGPTSVPAGGMEEIPRQLAGRLAPGTIRTGVTVLRVGKGEVELDSGEVLRGRAVVVATEGPEAARLLRGKLANPGSRGTTTLWFELPEPAEGDPVLILNGEGRGPVNHMAFMDRVSERYAPEGKGLAALNVLDDDLPEEIRMQPGADPTAALLPAVDAQMKEWFGSSARKWRHLRTYRIDHAHPLQTPRSFDPPVRSSRLGRDLWVAGDHRENASLNGALGSGRRTAHQLMEELASG